MTATTTFRLLAFKDAQEKSVIRPGFRPTSRLTGRIQTFLERVLPTIDVGGSKPARGTEIDGFRHDDLPQCVRQVSWESSELPMHDLRLMPHFVERYEFLAFFEGRSSREVLGHNGIWRRGFRATSMVHWEQMLEGSKKSEGRREAFNQGRRYVRRHLYVFQSVRPLGSLVPMNHLAVSVRVVMHPCRRGDIYCIRIWRAELCGAWRTTIRAR